MNFCLSTRQDHTSDKNCTQGKEQARSKSPALHIFGVKC